MSATLAGWAGVVGLLECVGELEQFGADGCDAVGEYGARVEPTRRVG